MRIHTIVVLLALAAFCQAAGKTAEEQLRDLDKLWAEAEVKKDFTALDKVMADDYSQVNADGSVMTKAQWFSQLKSSDFVILSEVPSDVTVRVFGDAAVVTGVSTVKARNKGREESGGMRYTSVYVKRGGVWKCVAGHGSNISQK